MRPGKRDARKLLLKAAIANQLCDSSSFPEALSYALDVKLSESEINEILDKAARVTAKAREDAYRKGRP